jgi:alpha-tubulin suppressor-like RCC1 family protein
MECAKKPAILCGTAPFAATYRACQPAVQTLQPCFVMSSSYSSLETQPFTPRALAVALFAALLGACSGSSGSVAVDTMGAERTKVPQGEVAFPGATIPLPQTPGTPAARNDAGTGNLSSDAGAAGVDASTDVGGARCVTQIDTAYKHTCAVKGDGSLWCWGAVSGPKPRSYAPAGSGFTFVSTGARHTCALKSDGTVWCWGDNESAQLGVSPGQQILIPTQVNGLAGKVVHLALGAYSSCVVNDGGTVACWGGNERGQTGGSPQTAVVKTPTVVANLVGVKSLSARDATTCALTGDGSTWCWGPGSQGTDVIPALQARLPAATQISVGQNHRCARIADGTLQCWGNNSAGQIGDGTLDVRFTPIQVKTIDSSIAQVSAGGVFTMARRTDNSLWGWGFGAVTPAPVSVFGNTVAHVASGYRHACVLRMDGSVWCWGDNDQGQNGTGTATTAQTPPAQVVGLCL